METETGITKRTRSLTTTLALAFFSVSAFVLLLSSGLQIALNIRTQQAALSSRQQLIAQDASKSVSNFIQEKFSSLATVVEFANPVNTTPETRKTIMEGLLGLHPAFQEFALLDRQGRQLAQVSRTSQKLSPQFVDQLQGEVLTQAVSEQRYISPIYIDDTSSEPLIVISIPIKNELGDAQGTLVAEVNLKFMWDLVDQLKVGNTGYAYVVDAQGDLIAYRDTAIVLRGENLMQIGEVAQFVHNPTLLSDVTPDLVSYTGLNGSTVVGTYAPLGTPQWAVVIELPWREAYQDVIALGLQSLAIILGIAILAGLIGALVARQSAAPLVELSNVADEVAKGNMSSQAKTSGPTEVVNLAVAFNSMTGQLRDLINTLEERIEERTNELSIANTKNERRATQFEAVAQLARTIASRQDLDKLLANIVEVISGKFNYDHVGIFLNDDASEYTILSAASSENGRRLFDRGYKLKIGSSDIVASVANTGHPRVAQDLRETPADLTAFPETRSQLAIPLKSGEKVLGVIDAQSNTSGSFDQTDIEIFSILSDQIAIAIQNATLFRETQAALSESQILYGTVIKQAWKINTQGISDLGYRFAGHLPTRLVKPITSPEAYSAMESGDIVVTPHDQTKGDNTLAVPLKLRGEIIGVINITMPVGLEIGEDEIDIVRTAAERIALALENSSLLDDSQRRAVRERTIGEMSARIGAGTEIDAILKTAVRELGSQMGGVQISVEIGSDNE